MIASKSVVESMKWMMLEPFRPYFCLKYGLGWPPVEYIPSMI